MAFMVVCYVLLEYNIYISIYRGWCPRQASLVNKNERAELCESVLSSITSMYIWNLKECELKTFKFSNCHTRRFGLFFH